jgi:hypothetical protein
MSNVYFPALIVDDDDIVESQVARTPNEVLSDVSAAPASATYIVSGVVEPGDVLITAIPISELAAGDIDISNNTITCRTISISNQASGASGIFTDLTCTSINVSSNVGLQCSSASSVETSASVGIAGDVMPFPAPSIWLRMEADGQTHVSERDFGYNVAVIGVSSVPNYFAWDDSGTNNRLYVSADGVYKVTANCSVISDTTIEVSLNLKINSNLVHYATQMVHTLTDPHRISLTYVGPVEKNQAIELTRTADGAAAIAFKKNSTLLIERIG